MNYKNLHESINEDIKKPLEVGDWVEGPDFNVGDVLHTDGKRVTVKLIDSGEEKDFEDIRSYKITDLKVKYYDELEKKQLYKKFKKYYGSSNESKIRSVYEDFSYSADRAKFHLDKMSRLAKDTSDETNDLVRYLKDVLSFLSKIDFKKIKKK